MVVDKMTTWCFCPREQDFVNYNENSKEFYFVSFPCTWLMASGGLSEKPADVNLMATLEKKTSSNTNSEDLLRAES